MLAGNNSFSTRNYYQARPTNKELSFLRSYLYNNNRTLLYKRCKKITVHNHCVTRNYSIADFFVIFSLSRFNNNPKTNHMSKVTRTMENENLLVDLEGITIKISKMKLWVLTPNNPTPRHRFRLSVYDFKGKRKFYENVVICGSYEDFEFEGCAKKYIERVLHRMKREKPNLVFQSIDNREMFKKFLAEFENTLTTMLDNEPPPLCQLF